MQSDTLMKHACRKSKTFEVSSRKYSISKNTTLLLFELEGMCVCVCEGGEGSSTPSKSLDLENNIPVLSYV